MRSQIWFDGLGTYTHFGLLLASQEIEPAAPRETTVQVPGCDGTLDLSEAAGRLLYDDRTAKFSFLLPRDIPETARSLYKTLHGKRMSIVTPDSPGRYLTGRVSVGPLLYHRSWGRLTITCRCGPFYTAVQPNRVVLRKSGTRTIRSGSAVPVIADVSVTGDAWQIGEQTFAAGEDGQLTLQPGENVLTAVCSGSGTLTLSYREVTL